MVHPCQKWFEWNGGKGVVEFYDKTTKAQVEVGKTFGFLVLDTTYCITGYNERANTLVVSNEVRKTQEEVLEVKILKQGTVAKGLYSEIRDRVTSKSVGGKFTANVYLAFFDQTPSGSVLQIGCLRLHGAALNTWIEFAKANWAALQNGAVKITGSTKGKKGSIEFFTPNFAAIDAKPETNEAAIALDKKLQAYLNSRTAVKSEPGMTQADPPQDYDQEPTADEPPAEEPPTDEDGPF